MVKNRSRVGRIALIAIIGYITCFSAAVGVKLYFEYLDQQILANAAKAETERLTIRYNPPWFSKVRYSTTSPNSLWIVANKKHPIVPIDYKPSSLSNVQDMQVNSKIANDLIELLEAANGDAVKLNIISAYRSYENQQQLFSTYVAQDGQAIAEGYSARPGHSEHQLGLAVDFDNTSGGCTLDGCFSHTPEGIWLANNAHRFGFILRYPEGKSDVTGYIPESWHYRYVGKDLAMEMNRTGVSTMEEFFGIEGGNYTDALNNNTRRDKITNNTY